MICHRPVWGGSAGQSHSTRDDASTSFPLLCCGRSPRLHCSYSYSRSFELSCYAVFFYTTQFTQHIAARSLTHAMARGSGAASSPAAATPALKRSTSSTQNMKNQRSILGFFQKSSPATPSTATRNAEPASSPTQRVAAGKSSTVKSKSAVQNLTPVPSSDAIEPDEEDDVPQKVSSSQLKDILLFRIVSVC